LGVQWQTECLLIACQIDLLRPLSHWGDAIAIRSRKKSTTLNSWRVIIASWSRWWEKRHYELKVRTVTDCKVIFFSWSNRSFVASVGDRPNRVVIASHLARHSLCSGNQLHPPGHCCGCSPWTRCIYLLCRPWNSKTIHVTVIGPLTRIICHSHSEEVTWTCSVMNIVLKWVQFPVSGCCEHGKGPSSSIKLGGFFQYLRFSRRTLFVGVRWMFGSVDKTDKTILDWRIYCGWIDRLIDWLTDR
jgi:hypothetical protein